MIYLLHGEDSRNLLQHLKSLKEKYQAENSSVGIEDVIITADISDQNLRSRLQESLESQGLFASSKMVILRSFLLIANKFPLSEVYITEALENLPKEISLIFAETEGFDKRQKLYKKLKKIAEVKEFVIPLGEELKTYVSKRFSEQGFKIDSAALALFLEKLGQVSNLWQVEQEIAKLTLYRHQEKVVDEKSVLDVVPVNIEQNIFALTNAVAAGQTREAINLLEQMLSAGSTELKSQTIQIIGALASQIRSLLLVKELEKQSPGEIAKTLNWKEGRVWINLKLTKKFSKPKLVRLLSDLRAIDLRLKTSEEPPKLLLTLFLKKAEIA